LDALPDGRATAPIALLHVAHVCNAGADLLLEGLDDEAIDLVTFFKMDSLFKLDNLKGDYVLV